MNRYTPIFIGLGSGVLILTVFLWQFVQNLSQPVSLFHNDWYLLTFMLDHYMSVIRSGDWTSWSTYPMFFGFSNSIFFGEFFPVHIFVGYLVYALTHNIFFVSNVLVLLTIFFSYASLFLLCFYLTRRVWPSVIAGIIYSVNPFITGRFPDHLLVLNAGFLPLILLCIELLFAKPHRATMMWLFLLFIGQLLTSSIYYSIFLTVLLPLYVGIRGKTMGWPEKSAVINRGTRIGLILFLLCITGIYIMYSKGNTNLYAARSQESTAAYSAILTDWLFTAPNNVLYGRLKPWAAGQFPSVVREGIYSEHNLFTGIIPFFLGLYGLWVLVAKKRDARLNAICVVGMLSWLLTFGPEWTVGDGVRIPGIYAFIDAIHPLFGFLRVPSRFGIFVFLSLSVCVAYGLSWAKLHLSNKRYLTLILCVTVGILGEYMIYPVDFLVRDSSLKRAYDTINSRSDIRVLAEYPMGNSIDYAFPQARMEELDAHYLAYALLYHNKKLLNGYSGFIPREYQKRADFLSVNFPTRSKLTQLKSWGTDALAVHRHEFREKGQYEHIIAALSNLSVPILSSTEAVSIYDLTAWPADP